jgi:hypothetical protein
MEDITTELKLKVAQLENEKRGLEARYIEELRKKDDLIATMMVDVANYKRELKKVKEITFHILEVLSD